MWEWNDGDSYRSCTHSRSPRRSPGLLPLPRTRHRTTARAGGSAWRQSGMRTPRASSGSCAPSRRASQTPPCCTQPQAPSQGPSYPRRWPRAGQVPRRTGAAGAALRLGQAKEPPQASNTTALRTLLLCLASPATERHTSPSAHFPVRDTLLPPQRSPTGLSFPLPLCHSLASKFSPCFP